MRPRAAKKIHCHLKGPVVLRIGRYVGLRTSSLLAFPLEMVAQRGLTADRGSQPLCLRLFLHPLEMGCNAFGLHRAPAWRVVERRRQFQRIVASTDRRRGLHRTFSERPRAKN